MQALIPAHTQRAVFADCHGGDVRGLHYPVPDSCCHPPLQLRVLLVCGFGKRWSELPKAKQMGLVCQLVRLTLLCVLCLLASPVGIAHRQHLQLSGEPLLHPHPLQDLYFPGSSPYQVG